MKSESRDGGVREVRKTANAGANQKAQRCGVIFSPSILLTMNLVQYIAVGADFVRLCIDFAWDGIVLVKLLTNVAAPVRCSACWYCR